jgi:hypothetical protein
MHARGLVRELGFEFGDALCEPLVFELEGVGVTAGGREVAGDQWQEGAQARQAVGATGR